MTPKQTFRGLMFVLIVGVIVLGIAWRLLPQSRSLDAISQDLGIPIMFYSESYLWISDQEVLRVEVNVSSRVDNLCRVPLQSQEAVRLDALERAVKTVGTGSLPMLSPDGKRIERWAVDIGPPRIEWLASMSLDGSSVVKWPAVKGGIHDYVGHGWLPDSSSYFIAFVDRLLLFPMLKPGHVERIAISKLHPEQRYIGANPEGLLFSQPYSAGVNVPLTLVRWNTNPRTPEILPPISPTVVV